LSQPQLTPSVPLLDSEKSETGEELTEYLAEVVSVSDIIESLLSLPLDEELVPVVEVGVQELEAGC
jgi:hypothetical protein